MVRRFFSQALLYHKGRTAAFNLVEFLCFDAGYPIVTLIFYCLLASYSFKTTDLTHWVIGNAFLMCTNTCVFGLGGIFNGERYYGRLRSIVASPCNKLALILANGVYPTIFATAAVAGGFVVGGGIFKIDFSEINLGLAALTIICAMFAASGLGLLLAVFGLISDSMHLILNVVSYILMIFTGAEFPVSQLPRVGQWLSRLLPLTHSIEAMNVLFGKSEGDFYCLLLGELGIAIFYILTAWVVLCGAEQACRKNGKFDLF